MLATVAVIFILLPFLAETYVSPNIHGRMISSVSILSQPRVSELSAFLGRGGGQVFASTEEYARLGKRMSEVLIESPSMNSRRITANIIIDTPINTVWSILTDYNNLATHVPNLVKSYLVPSPSRSIRLFQEGAQKIIGFDFRASLVMDMREEKTNEDSGFQEWNLRFSLVESRMFDSFDGQWCLKPHSRIRELDPVTNQFVYRYNTKLTYSVFVRPKGPVPVIALEWRIKEDIPFNLYAVKVAAEKLYISRNQNDSTSVTTLGPSV